jgi:hypothetical protein
MVMLGSESLGPASPWRRVAHTSLTLLALLVLGSAFVAGGEPGRAQVSGSTVHYSAGWNLVAAPSGTVLGQALPPYFAYGPSGTDYVPVGPGALVGGRAVWAYFPTAADVTLGSTAADSTRVQAPADRWLLLGNPSTTQPLAVVGADAALGYAAPQGYVPVSLVPPGQGVWVLRHTAGPIRLANAADPRFEQRLSALQTALTADPTGRLSYDQATALGGELVAARAYSEVQVTADDLLAALADGLLEQGAPPLPPASSLQLTAATSVREALAQAQAAAAAGDTATADGLIEQAKKAAQTSADDGLALARGQGGTAVVGYASAGTGYASAPGALSTFGALIRAGLLSLALGQPLSNDFWSVASAVLTGQLLPAASPQPPSPSSTPVSTPPATSPTMPPCGGAKGIALTAAAGVPGTTVGFVAVGFTPGQVGVLQLQGSGATPAPVQADCAAAGVFVVPALPPGPYAVSFQTPQDGAATPTFFQVLRPALPSATASPPPSPTPLPSRTPSLTPSPVSCAPPVVGAVAAIGSACPPSPTPSPARSPTPSPSPPPSRIGLSLGETQRRPL